MAVNHCKSRGGVSSHFFLDSRAPIPKHCWWACGKGKVGPFLGMPPRISPCVLVPTAPKELLNSVRTLPDPWWPFTTRAHCLASATPLGPSATPAALRAGSARAGPTSSGGSVPAVRRASMGSRTASVSAHTGPTRSCLIQADETHPGQGLSSFTVLETHLGIL